MTLASVSVEATDSSAHGMLRATCEDLGLVWPDRITPLVEVSVFWD